MYHTTCYKWTLTVLGYVITKTGLAEAWPPLVFTDNLKHQIGLNGIPIVNKLDSENNHKVTIVNHQNIHIMRYQDSYMPFEH